MKKNNCKGLGNSLINVTIVTREAGTNDYL